MPFHMKSKTRRGGDVGKERGGKWKKRREEEMKEVDVNIKTKRRGTQETGGRGRKKEKEGRAEGRREGDGKTFQHGFRALNKLSHSLTFLRTFSLKRESILTGN